MEDDGDFDDFLMDSIRRYNTLQIFHVENVPHHLLRLNDLSLCVVSRRAKGNNSELLRLELPKKLSLLPHEEGLSKDNDFKVLSGLYTESHVQTVGKLDFGNKVVTSESNILGLRVYDLQERLNGLNKNAESITTIPWTNPNFVIVKSSNSILCSKSGKDPLLLVDSEAKKIIRKIDHNLPNLPLNINSLENDRNIRCDIIQQNFIIALNSETGDMSLHDLRSNALIKNIPKPNVSNLKELWNVSMHDCSSLNANNFGILSNWRNFMVFDKRNMEKMFEKHESGSSFNCAFVDSLKFKFSDKEDKFSISGWDSNVKVFSFSDKQYSQVFEHNGHCPSNPRSALVTDHIWLPVGYKELVISACDNKTLHCWEFNLSN